MNIRNIRELFEEQVKRSPDKVFSYFGDQQITYGEFDANINRAANVFLDLGIQKGDRICFFWRTVPNFFTDGLG